MRLITHGESLRTKAVCVGMAERVLLIRTVRPALVIIPAFQLGRRLATLSTRGCKSDLLSLRIPSGMPKYLMGKGSNLPGKFATKLTVACKSHCIGEMCHLLGFILRPEAHPKISRMILISVRSCCSVDEKMTTSSAYRKILSQIFGCSLPSSCCSSARCSKAFRTSMTSTNNRGDRGSPCRSPLA